MLSKFQLYLFSFFLYLYIFTCVFKPISVMEAIFKDTSQIPHNALVLFGLQCPVFVIFSFNHLCLTAYSNFPGMMTVSCPAACIKKISPSFFRLKMAAYHCCPCTPNLLLMHGWELKCLLWLRSMVKSRAHHLFSQCLKFTKSEEWLVTKMNQTKYSDNVMI